MITRQCLRLPLLLALLVWVAILMTAQPHQVTAFVVVTRTAAPSRPSGVVRHALLPALEACCTAAVTTTTTLPSSCCCSSTVTLSAATLDPTTLLQDVFSGLLGTPLILAVPIVAALAVASLLAYLIVAYAQPAEPDDDDE